VPDGRCQWCPDARSTQAVRPCLPAAPTGSVGRVTTLKLDTDGVDARRSDGGAVHLRSITADDAAGVIALHERASDRSIYFRFFSSNRVTAERYVQKLIGPNGSDHHGLAALVGEEIVGVASFERIDRSTAEIALLVDDTRHHQGIGTLLLERLSTVARTVGVRSFVADVLTENSLMAEVLHHLGYRVRTESDHGTDRVVFDIADGVDAHRATAERDRSAEAASLTAVLAPRSIAVIGYAGRMWPWEKMLSAAITRTGFTGAVHSVGGDRASAHGTRSVAAVGQLSTPPDMAIVLGRGPEALARIDECGVAGVRAVVVQNLGRAGSGSAPARLRAEMLAAARHHGMRLVGPGSVGVVNTDPDVQLNSTAIELPMLAGGLGLVAQSGELGLSVVLAAAASGLGVSQFVALGDCLDVTEVDVLLRWAHDPRTQVIGVLIEQLVEPERFSSVARRVAEHTPVLAVVTPERFVRRTGLQTRSQGCDVIASLRGAGVHVLPTTRALIAAAHVFSS
jgi:succinyl-CoA synthetase alpha subunit/GNAT superfamily N-acetyltransferase